MKTTFIKGNKNNVLVEFNSISDLVSYIKGKPTSQAFLDYCKKKYIQEKSLEQNKSALDFTGTKSFDEAMTILQNGWSEMAKEIENGLKVKNKINNNSVKMKTKAYNSVCGYQAIVPAYLQGLPNSMVNKKLTPIKNKVVNIVKSISYSCDVSTKTIKRESIDALRLIQNLEAQGYRCNLDIILSVGAFAPNIYFSVKVRIKSANERLNVSKVAFPLVHPSMLRRIMFRLIEVNQDISSKIYFGYGLSIDEDEYRKIGIVNSDAMIIPKFIYVDVDNINDIKDVCV